MNYVEVITKDQSIEKHVTSSRQASTTKMLNQKDKENDHYRLSTIDIVHKPCKGCNKRHYP
jgi:hypothetical protein